MFHFDVHDDVRVKFDAFVEKDEVRVVAEVAGDARARPLRSACGGVGPGAALRRWGWGLPQRRWGWAAVGLGAGGCPCGSPLVL